ncbi:glycosyltransferase family 61 protein [Methylobacterium sp. E-065]|uniref:glycosyltransferase family 61 protein n=1 Tax=Methylobacterium sp. E-065 TaxID=2836583 RepID=UPI001FBA25EE|nr:glycosyltransferase 61 family protein [Methylobacterium sp. E-065]MCJ2016186.1 glycosyltransferase family 61 protein [Methylobacterium sp. E-065]
MSTNRRSGLRTRVSLLLARKLVDAEYYLDRYPDVRAAGVDPIRHFAECGYAVPIRAANPSMERAIIRLSPLLALAVVLLPIRRDDWVQCFVAHYQDLWCGDLGLKFRFARWVARLLATRAMGSGPAAASLQRIVGTTLPIARIGEDRAWLSVTKIDPPETHRFSSPRVWGANRAPIPREVTIPALWSATVRDANVFGAMQIAANGHFVAHEPAADPGLSFAAGQHRHVITCYTPQANKIVARIPSQPARKIDEAILLGGRCSNNYFHFLIEYLSRGYIIGRQGLARDLPLIVPENLFPSEIEALELFFPERTVIALSSQERLDVKRLHIPSLMTYLPDALEITDWKKEGFRRASLQWLRDRAYQALELDDTPRIETSRIFLARRRGRNIINAAAIEDVFASHGFAIVDPSVLTFREQVQLFAGASHIAGPLGAAFSNVVFCKSGTAVLGLGSRYAVTSSLYQNITELMGGHCTHLLSDRRIRDLRHLNKNIISLRQGGYEINTERLERLLTLWATEERLQ